MKSRSEAEVQKAVRKRLSLLSNAMFFRNAQAMTKIEGRFVKAGLGSGTSDLIGWVERTITPEMVGERVAVFASIEIKRENGGRLTELQRRFLERVKRAGGIAGVARSEREALEILKGER